MSEPTVPCVKPLNQTKEDGVLAKWTPDVFLYESGMRTSLPCETQDDRLQLYKMAESDCRPAKELINQSFRISDYICHGCELEGKDGELITAVRTILLCPGDRPVAFVSKAAFDFVKRTARHEIGQPAWDPPLTVTLRLVPTNKGTNVYKFHYDLPKRKR